MAEVQEQVVTQQMDPTKASYYDWLLGASQDYAGQGYTPYMGQRIAA